MPEFLKNLQKEALIVAAWKITLIFCAALGSCVALVALLDLVDRRWAWKEESVAPLLIGGVALLALVFVLFVMRAYQNRLQPRNLAAKVEEANPELMDTLNCAVDLVEKKGGDYNFMEDRVLQVAAERSNASAIAKAVRPDGRTKLFTMIALGLASVMIAYGVRWSPVQKTLGHFSGKPGLKVSTRLSAMDEASMNPADWEYAHGSDISIFVDVLRSYREGEVPELEYEQNGILSAPVQMFATGVPSRYSFDAPPLRDKIRYRVTTESLPGDWHELSSYYPPKLEKVTWRENSPKYTGGAEITHEGFAINKVLQNSRISLEAKVSGPPEVIAEVFSEGASIPIAKGPNGMLLLNTKLPVLNLTEEQSNKLEKIDLDYSASANPEKERSVEEQIVKKRDYQAARNDILTKEQRKKLKELSPWKGRIKLRDADALDREPVVSDEFSFLSIPDSSPSVEITEPAKDLELPLDGNLVVELYADDDHGVTAAEIILSHGGKRTTSNVFVGPVDKNMTLAHVLSLADMSLAVGDVVSYHAVVLDNMHGYSGLPEPQVARSEIYFIEVLPPQAEPREAEGMEGEQKEVPVRDFINRTKRIIRATYDALAEEGTERMERADAITGDALSLKHDMTKVYDEFDGQFPVVDGIDTAELLNEATYFIEQTEIFAGDGELQESLEPSEETLRKLVLLYALLRQNPMKSKGEGKGKPQEGETEQDENSEESAEDQPEDPAEELKALGEALGKTSELKERQQELNSRIGRAARNGKTGEANERMADEQGDIREDLEGLRDELYDRSGRLDDVRSFEQAGREMKKSGGELNKDDPAGAKPHGIRAAEALAQAEKELESRMLAAGAAMLEGLENKGRGLAQRQEENAAETEGGKPGEGEGLKGEQDKINEEVKDLLSKIEQAGLALRDLDEDATSELYGAAREARENGAESSGKRASNALLYEKFSRAKKEEDKVARELGRTSDKLGEVKRELASQNNLALLELIEELKKNREALPGMSNEEVQESSKEAASKLGGLPGAETDQLIKDSIEVLEKVAQDENPARAKTAANHALTDAIDRLEELVGENAAKERLRRNQETSSAPRKYKRQVDEYFRRIAEGE